MLQAFREEEVTDMMDAEIETKVCVGSQNLLLAWDKIQFASDPVPVAWCWEIERDSKKNAMPRPKPVDGVDVELPQQLVPVGAAAPGIGPAQALVVPAELRKVRKQYRKKGGRSTESNKRIYQSGVYQTLLGCYVDATEQIRELGSEPRPSALLPVADMEMIKAVHEARLAQAKKKLLKEQAAAEAEESGSDESSSKPVAMKVAMEAMKAMKVQPAMKAMKAKNVRKKLTKPRIGRADG